MRQVGRGCVYIYTLACAAYIYITWCLCACVLIVSTTWVFIYNIHCAESTLHKLMQFHGPSTQAAHNIEASCKFNTFLTNYKVFVFPNDWPGKVYKTATMNSTKVQNPRQKLYVSLQNMPTARTAKHSQHHHHYTITLTDSLLRCFRGSHIHFVQSILLLSVTSLLRCFRGSPRACHACSVLLLPVHSLLCCSTEALLLDLRNLSCSFLFTVCTGVSEALTCTLSCFIACDTLSGPALRLDGKA